MFVSVLLQCKMQQLIFNAWSLLEHISELGLFISVYACALTQLQNCVLGWWKEQTKTFLLPHQKWWYMWE